MRSTNITLQWNRVACIDRNSEITHYALYYSLEGSGESGEVSVPRADDSERMYTVTRLQPQSSYTLAIAAVNNYNQRGPNNSITVTTSEPESKIDCQSFYHVIITIIMQVLFSKFS